jgi:hypothetical protein
MNDDVRDEQEEASNPFAGPPSAAWTDDTTVIKPVGDSQSIRYVIVIIGRFTKRVE